MARNNATIGSIRDINLNITATYPSLVGVFDDSSLGSLENVAITTKAAGDFSGGFVIEVAANSHIENIRKISYTGNQSFIDIADKAYINQIGEFLR